MRETPIQTVTKSSFYPFFFITEINFHFWEVVFSVFLYLWQVQINVALNNIAICRNKHSSISLSKKKKKKIIYLTK